MKWYKWALVGLAVLVAAAGTTVGVVALSGGELEEKAETPAVVPGQTVSEPAKESTPEQEKTESTAVSKNEESKTVKIKENSPKTTPEPETEKTPVVWDSDFYRYLKMNAHEAWGKGDLIQDAVICRDYNTFKAFVENKLVADETASEAVRAQYGDGALEKYPASYFENGGALLLLTRQRGSGMHGLAVTDVYMQKDTLVVEAVSSNHEMVTHDSVKKVYCVELKNFKNSVSQVRCTVGMYEYGNESPEQYRNLKETLSFTFPIR